MSFGLGVGGGIGFVGGAFNVFKIEGSAVLQADFFVDSGVLRVSGYFEGSGTGGGGDIQLGPIQLPWPGTPIGKSSKYDLFDASWHIFQ